MSKAAQTRQLIIEKSASIFNIKGYDNTSLSDIQKAVSLTKGAIYGNFSDKNELAIAAYEYSSSRIIKVLSDRMAGAPCASEALMAYPGYYVENWHFLFEKGGCPLMNAAIEADDHLHFMRDIVRQSMSRFLRLLQERIEIGQKTGEFNRTADAKTYAAILFSIMEGNILLAKMMNDRAYLQLASDRIQKVITEELVL